MNSIEILKNQIIKVKQETEHFINSIAIEKWHLTPSVIETNMNWQLGHLILANYLHGIASISGASEKVRDKINIQDFITFYGPNSIPSKHLDQKPLNEELLNLYAFIFEEIINGIDKIDINDLGNPTAIPNPSATTKFEALTRLTFHQSWHNGQIAMLQRILNTN